MDDDSRPLTRSALPLGSSPFLPLLLLSIALVGWFAFQTFQLIGERKQLDALKTGQEAQIEAAARVRASLDTMAAATGRLAEGGNVNARILVEELRKRGITINSAATTPASPK